MSYEDEYGVTQRHQIERFEQRHDEDVHIWNFLNTSANKFSAQCWEEISFLSMELQGIRRAFDGFIVVLCENGSWLMFEVSCGKASSPSKRVKDPSVTSKSFCLFFVPSSNYCHGYVREKAFFCSSHLAHVLSLCLSRLICLIFVSLAVCFSDLQLICSSDRPCRPFLSNQIFSVHDSFLWSADVKRYETCCLSKHGCSNQ